MKPFGVRLAAGAVTILLGALAAAQAQKDQQNKSQSEWVVANVPSEDAPPTPIPAATMDDWSEPPSLAAGESESLDSRSQDSGQFAAEPAPSEPAPSEPAPSHSSAVLLVQHTETEGDGSAGEPDAAAEAPSMGFQMVDSTTGEIAPQNNAPALDLPPPGSAANAESVSLPGMTMTFPGDAAPTGVTGDLDNAGQAPTTAAGMPNLELAQPPSAKLVDSDLPPNDLRGESIAAGPTLDEEQPFVGDHPPATGGSFGAGPHPGPAGDDAAGPMPEAHFHDGPQPMLRSVSSADPSTPDTPPQEASGMPPQRSQPRFVDPPASSQSQPTLRYAQGPNQPVPNTSIQDGLHPGPAGLHPGPDGPGPAGSGYGAAAGYGTAKHGGAALDAAAYGSTAAAGAPVARIASLPHGNTGYLPRPIDGPVAAAPIKIDPNLTHASPGDRRLEGVQSPSVVIHKRAPREVKVGKPASFVIHVQNVGSAEALGVTVHDRVPAGMRLVDASPTPVQQGEMLVWELGAMSAGDERTVTMQLIPEQEGELGSVARVTFEAAASVRTISTRPELKITQKAPPQVLIGQQLEIELQVSNPGTGDATGVVLQEDVPAGLEHPKGKQLDNLLGTLAAGEVRRQVLRLRAVAPGVIQNQIRLTADDGLEAIDEIEVEVVAPQLQVALNGPQRRFLERQATYQLDIANVGTADATNVEIAAHLDRGFTFVSTDYEGQYDPNRHTVFWSLANLPKGGNGTVPLTLLPVEEGEQAIRLEARADLGVVATNERTVAVDSLAELTFSINDVSDPIEVGGETVYEIRLTNSGSRNDSNVRVQLQLPSGLSLLGVDGDAQEDGRGGVFFEPRSQLAANDEVIYRVRAQGTAAGTHLVKAIVTSDQSTTPVTKEESTMVYADR